MQKHFSRVKDCVLVAASGETLAVHSTELSKKCEGRKPL